MSTIQELGNFLAREQTAATPPPPPAPAPVPAAPAPAAMDHGGDGAATTGGD
jgi:hypothetical protein